jgi:tetratricopeptide (TPR) repeat protein
MSEQSACAIVPFGVPVEARGLGLGLAAAVLHSARIQGSAAAIARLQVSHGQGWRAPRADPVEAELTPEAWREMARKGDHACPSGVVITGVFEPPSDGEGAIRLLAFDAHDGQVRCKIEARIDAERAGAAIVAAIGSLWSDLGGDIGRLVGLRDLAWEPLESVLRAERCALHDAPHGGPRDGLAAMVHLGRAIEDAPEAEYPVERLAAIALEAASAPATQSKVASAALRALERAAEDASKPFELTEALGALLVRLGKVREAERRMNAAIAQAPERSRPYAVLAQSLLAQSNFEGAVAVLDAGLAAAGDDVSLHVERGAALAAWGRPDAALGAWRQALALEPLNPRAFGHLASLALRSNDGGLAQSLVDAALAAESAHPDLFRSAIRLVLDSEPEGLSRASRIARLCHRALAQSPNDAWVLVASARALLALGQRAEARAILERVERIAPASAPAADAQAARLALDHPRAELELQSVMRAAQRAPLEKLTEVIARARRLATEHDSWRGWLAVATAEGRRCRWVEARASLEIALERAPGAAAVHLEMASVMLALGEGSRARTHAEAAMAAEGPSPRAQALLSAAARVGSDRSSSRASGVSRYLKVKRSS